MHPRPLVLLLALGLALVGLTPACGPESPTDPGPSALRPGDTAVGNMAAPPLPVERDDLDDDDPPVDCDPFVEPHEPDRLVVRLNFARSTSAAAFESRFGATILDPVGIYDLIALNSGTDLRQTASDMVEEGWCQTAEPSSYFYLGQEIILGFFETDPSETNLTPDPDWTVRTDLPLLQEVVHGENVIVAILDSGVHAAATHTLATRLSPAGADFVDPGTGPLDEEGGPAHGHGTLVADIVHQVAPDATILPLRVMDPGGAVLARHVVVAIDHARANGASVVNMSFGGCVQPQFVETALQAAWMEGIVLVASAGNAGRHDEAHYPSSSPFVCSVAATNALDDRASFTSYATTVDLAAPGAGIVGAGPGGGGAIGFGTSFATPMVSGAVAAKMQMQLPFTPDEYRLALRGSAMPLSEDMIFLLGYLGGGRIDFDGFLQTAP